MSVYRPCHGCSNPVAASEEYSVHIEQPNVEELEDYPDELDWRLCETCIGKVATAIGWPYDPPEEVFG